MSKARDKKIETVGILEEKVKRAKAVVLTDYRGLKHQQLESLKKALKTVGAELVVSKNTLLKLAFQKTQQVSGSVNQQISLSENQKSDRPKSRITESPNHRLTESSEFSGPTATLFAYNDVIAPLKELAKMIKLLKMPTIKLGIFEGRAITAEQVLQIASFPSREMLIAQVVGGMKAPIYGLHRALRWNLQRLVMTLEAIGNKKASSNQPSAIS